MSPRLCLTCKKRPVLQDTGVDGRRYRCEVCIDKGLEHQARMVAYARTQRQAMLAHVPQVGDLVERLAHTARAIEPAEHAMLLELVQHTLTQGAHA